MEVEQIECIQRNCSLLLKLLTLCYDPLFFYQTHKEPVVVSQRPVRVIVDFTSHLKPNQTFCT